MHVIDEYKLSHRKSPGHVRLAQVTGLLPLLLAFSLMAAKNYRMEPGLWCALGIALALEMILWSAYSIHFVDELSWSHTKKLVRNSDQWFPYCVIYIHGAFFGLTVLLLWFALCDLGYHTTIFQNSLLVILVLLGPVYRVLRNVPPDQQSVKLGVTNQLMGHTLMILTTLLIVGSLTSLILPPDQPLTTDVPGTALILWIMAVLVILSCIMLFVDYLLKLRAARRESEQ